MGNIITPKCWIFLAYIYPWARNIHTIDSASEENTQIKVITSNLLAISVGICFLHVQETCSYTTLYACVFQHIVLPKLPNCATLKKSRLLFNWDDVSTNISADCQHTKPTNHCGHNPALLLARPLFPEPPSKIALDARLCMPPVYIDKCQVMTQSCGYYVREGPHMYITDIDVYFE